MSRLAASRPWDGDAGGALAPRPDLREGLALLAQAHGFGGALYVHLGRDGGSPRVVATAPFHDGANLSDLDLASDPLAERAAQTLTPFVWSLHELSRAARAPRAVLVRQLAWRGVQAGVIAPAHHHLIGPAFLNLFVREAAVLDRRDLAPLMLAAAQFHSAAVAQEGLRGNADARPGQLSVREAAVLRFAAMGRTEQETAEALRLSRRTIQYHLASAVEKLKAPNKTAAVARAVGAGLIVLPLEEPGRHDRLDA